MSVGSKRSANSKASKPTCQDLIEEVGTRIWHFDQHTITDLEGAYEEYTAALA